MTTRVLLLALLLGAACSQGKTPELAPERTASVPLEDSGRAPLRELDTMSPEPARAEADAHIEAEAEVIAAPDVETPKDSETPETAEVAEAPSQRPSETPSVPTEPAPSKDEDEPVAEPEESEKPSRKGDLTLQKMTLTNQIVDRLPDKTRTEWVVGRDAEFLVWMEWKNSGPEVSLETVWKQGGKEKWRFPFQVGSGKTWRTWVKRRVNKKDAGAWTVQVVDSSGHVYRSMRFHISGN